MTFQSIQYLRAAAALSIVLYHTDIQLIRWGYGGWWPHWLGAGVDVFFVVSGFIIWSTAPRQPGGTLAFFRRRAERIVPLYWLLTTAALAVVLLRPGLAQSGAGFSPWHVLASYCFIPALHPVLHRMEPVLVPGWTLNYEVFFYALFGLALRLPPRGRLLAIGIVLGGLVALGAAAGFPDETVAEFYTDSIMLEFLLGMGLGAVLDAGWRLGAAASAASLLCGALAIVAGAEFGRDLPRILVIGLPALLIVGGALMLECAGRVRAWPPLRRVGDASYSIYLSHAWLLSLLGQGWTRLGLEAWPGGWAAYCTAALALAIASGLLMFRFVERPLLGLLRRHDRHRAPRLAVPPA